MFKIEIDLNQCNGCGQCVDICPSEVLMLEDGKAKAVNEEFCVGCESCVDACDQEAISVTGL